MDSLTKEFTVTEETLAVNVGSGSLRVLATPMVCAFLENAAAQLAQQFVDEGCTTVGTRLAVDHTAPTPLGGKVTVTVHLTKNEGRAFHFELAANDAAGSIAVGEHDRVSVKSDRFQEKADARI